MKLRNFKFSGVLVAAGLLVGLVTAFAADDAAPQQDSQYEAQLARQAEANTFRPHTAYAGETGNQEEIRLAERAVSKKEVATESFQKDLETLTEEKATWQREVAKIQDKLTYADDQLHHFTILAVQPQVEKWQNESSAWQTQLTSAQFQLTRVEGELQKTILAFQSSLQEAYGNLILPGESLEIFVTEDETLNGMYQVRRGGYIILPRVGRIFVAGKDLAGAERAVKEALQVTQIKEADVMVERAQATAIDGGPAIYLAGEFLRPGAWRIPVGVAPTVVTTILRSGGMTSAADLTKVKVLRLINGQGLVDEVDVQAILGGGNLTSDMSLSPGDIVVVPAFANVVYVTGTVAKPGPMRLLPDDELTAYSAILRSGGFGRFANLRKVYVLRDTGEGPKQRIAIDIKDVQSGRVPDVVLQSKDIVVVPERFFSW